MLNVSDSPKNATPKDEAKIKFVATMVLVRADPMCCVAAKSMVRAKQTLKIPAMAMKRRGQPRPGHWSEKSPIETETIQRTGRPTMAEKVVPVMGSIPRTAKRPKISLSASKTADMRAYTAAVSNTPHYRK